MGRTRCKADDHARRQAFGVLSIELAGKYAAFDEIDMTEYLAARRKAVAQVSATDPYAALLISMHTVNLLTERADRSTIAPAQLPLLDAFLREQAGVQHNLRNEIEDDLGCSSMDISNATIQKNFRLLQACHHWSELGCVGFAQPSSRLHPLATTDGGASAVLVTASAPRRFRLEPYPLDEPDLRFEVPARYVEGQTFASDEELQEKFAAAQAEGLTITVHP